MKSVLLRAQREAATQIGEEEAVSKTFMTKSIPKLSKMTILMQILNIQQKSLIE